MLRRLYWPSWNCPNPKRYSPGGESNPCSATKHGSPNTESAFNFLVPAFSLRNTFPELSIYWIAPVCLSKDTARPLVLNVSFELVSDNLKEGTVGLLTKINSRCSFMPFFSHWILTALGANGMICNTPSES